MYVVCTDLEGIFVPEIWINVAERTGIEELRATTRDIPDYDVLMRQRLSLLDAHHIKLKNITDVIATMDPLPGAREFLDWLRERLQVIVVSDTFSEFAHPLMRKLGWPTLFCHSLSTNGSGAITSYKLRQKDSKRQAVLALKKLSYKVISVGDSYNDITMLKEADKAILFRPPQNVVDEYPQFPMATEYDQLKSIIEEII
ncbi:MAG: bifunctional phosphoserine phosphatase/homoserine phosphotransferase ThrH [Desulfobacteraceae bacterium]|nr:bifunctional phosphoserine phosphatase/homoserine phosphotransferase ThrH [Desulfobacteraceae bacterium]